MREAEWVGFRGWSGKNLLGLELEGHDYGEGEEEEDRQNREMRENVRGVARRKKEERGCWSRTILLKCPSLSLSFYLSIGQLLNRLKSLVQSRASYSKPKSITHSFINYSFPNISRFNLINIKLLLRLTI